MIRIRNAAPLLLLAGLAACGGGGGGDSAGGTTPPVVVGPPPIQTQIGGVNFGKAFDASPNTVATDPAPGDVPPVDPTKNPTDT